MLTCGSDDSGNSRTSRRFDRRGAAYAFASLKTSLSDALETEPFQVHPKTPITLAVMVRCTPAADELGTTGTLNDRSCIRAVLATLPLLGLNVP